MNPTHLQSPLRTISAPILNTAKTHGALLRMLTHFHKLQTVEWSTNTVYDMREVIHCDPCLTLLLYRIAQEAGKPLGYLPPRSEACRKWLEQIGLVRRQGGTGGKFQRPKDLRKGQLAIRYLDQEEQLYETVDALVHLLTQHDALDAIGATYCSTVLAELALNTIQHGQGSRLKGALLCGQNYKKSRHSMVAVMDWGRTIPGTLSSADLYRSRTMTDGEWIRFSTQPKVTAGTYRGNHGMGLANLCRIFDVTGGTLHIVSRRGVYTRWGKGRERIRNLPANRPDFAGTLVVADLKSMGKSGR